LILVTPLDGNLLMVIFIIRMSTVLIGDEFFYLASVIAPIDRRLT